MFEDEGAHGVGVTLGANSKLSGGGAHLSAHLGTVRIMTVAALYESDIDAMAIRPGEFRPLRGMASIAQLRLRFHQQKVDVLGAVRTMAVGASDTIREMFGPGKVLRLQAGLVTLGADRCSLGRTEGFEANDLCDVAAALHMRLPGTMAGLAPVLVAFEQRGVRSIGEVLVPDILVAGLANVGFSVLARRGARQRG